MPPTYFTHINQLHACNIVTNPLLWYHLTFSLGEVTWPLLGQEEAEGVKVPGWKPHGGRRDLRPDWGRGREGEANLSYRDRRRKHSCRWGLRLHGAPNQHWIQDPGPGAAHLSMSESIRRRSSSRQLLQNLIRLVEMLLAQHGHRFFTCRRTWILLILFNFLNWPAVALWQNNESSFKPVQEWKYIFICWW